MNIIDDFTDKEQILDFLKKVDRLFPKPLSSSVDLDEYVEKVLHFGRITAVQIDNKVASLCMYYFNNMETQRAFITLIVTEEKHQHSGISQTLLDKTLDIVHQNGMKEIALEVDPSNIKAQSFYKRNHFIFESRDKMICMVRALE